MKHRSRSCACPVLALALAALLHSAAIGEETLRAAHLTPCADISATVAEELVKRGPEARVAVLPQGPLTIPYLDPAAAVV